MCELVLLTAIRGVPRGTRGSKSLNVLTLMMNGLVSGNADDEDHDTRKIMRKMKRL